MGIEVKSEATQKAPGMEAFKKQHDPDKVMLVGKSGFSWKQFLTDVFPEERNNPTVNKKEFDGVIYAWLLSECVP